MGKILLSTIPKAPGIYALILKVCQTLKIAIGSLGFTNLEPGIYCYIGSARGYGGLYSRIAHHIRKPKSRIRWHIDYLTNDPSVLIVSIVYAITNMDLESVFANNVSASRCWRPTIPHFGATDKRDYTHLYYCTCSYEECLRELQFVLEKLGLKPQTVTLNTH
ncbi:MAG TPA: GIY-YIG nuclease family protein [Ignisphaera aggregans]|uniref:GIY-YIG nuclease family protein n=1 Tax=Ignisphaera aggregans TaxID=334771 RepID=A0A832YSA8_9CREN|nr:GIY-YIG nuclease family protein [Ignisphaera aggregans]